MTTLLKDLYNKKFINSLSREFSLHYPDFNTKAFCANVFNQDWDQKELKARMRHITESLHLVLPRQYKRAINILKPVSTKFTGFEPMFFPDYVELYGMEDYTTSVHALEHFTTYSSSEFAVRPFINQYGNKMMKQMQRWAEADNHHVRRLASEGCRPRLPWAGALPQFKRDPQPVLTILDMLKNDESEYVRRSVANNLNDIAKDHPGTVIDVSKQWLGLSMHTDWIIKHACRTLLKQGNRDVLSLFGFREPNDIHITAFKAQKTTHIGDRLEFSCTIKSKHSELGKLRIEYAINFVMANGQLSKKVFKVAEGDYCTANKEICKQHSFKRITTRTYYPGRHSLTIIVNGREFDQRLFNLKAD